jgi:hypothetical protein
MAMLPQGSIVLGFVYMAEKFIPDFAHIDLFTQVVLAGMVIFEFLGPIFVDISMKTASKHGESLEAIIER